MKIKTNINNLNNYKIYLEVEEAVHEYLKSKGYLKIDLPVLSPALIPESYLEVFETEFNYFQNKEKFYLTPSPELFLKRLLTQGIGNCYYLGKAFRNSEPNSSWHLPEFTMLEFYKVGINYLEMADEVLSLMGYINDKLKAQSLKLRFKTNSSKLNSISFLKWEKLSVAEAVKKYADIDREILFNHDKFFKTAKEKNYQTNGFSYEDLFSQIFTQEVEGNLGKNGYPTLIFDYPKELASLAKLSQDNKIAERCEFYIDGLEIGGFCTELNNYKEQEKRFSNEATKRKKNRLINHTIDKGFIDALKYGLPECTGVGIGFDRLAMIFADVKSIEEVKLISIA